MDNAAQEVKNAINNGIDLIRDGAGIQATLATFIIQILATIVLFLIVRIFLWKTVTNLLDKRKQAEVDAINQKDQLLKENEELKEESKTIISNATLEASTIRQDIISNAEIEKQEIINDAKCEASKIKQEAHEEIEREISSKQEEIKQEIVTIAYELSQKITSENLTKEKNEELIDNFFKEKDND